MYDAALLKSVAGKVRCMSFFHESYSLSSNTKLRWDWSSEFIAFGLKRADYWLLIICSWIG